MRVCVYMCVCERDTGYWEDKTEKNQVSALACSTCDHSVCPGNGCCTGGGVEGARAVGGVGGGGTLPFCSFH